MTRNGWRVAIAVATFQNRSRPCAPESSVMRVLAVKRRRDIRSPDGFRIGDVIRCDEQSALPSEVAGSAQTGRKRLACNPCQEATETDALQSSSWRISDARRIV